MLVSTTPASHAQIAPWTTPGSLDWNSVCHINYTRDTWVKLLHQPSEYAFSEAKLLCPGEADSWTAWLPDHGECLLEKGDFYC